MAVEKSFLVFGELVEVLNKNRGGFSVIVQTCPPGGGPPPHFHEFEDEFFFPVEGEFEMFDGTAWKPLTQAGLYVEKNQVHTFRNSGSSEAKIQCVVPAGRFIDYLELISTLTLPQDMDRLMAVSAEYGISFVR